MPRRRYRVPGWSRPGVEARGEAVARQLAQVFTLGDGTHIHVALGVERGQLRVGACHRGCQHRARRLGFGLGDAVVGQCCLQGRAVLAPEIEIVIQAQLHAAWFSRRRPTGAGEQVGLGEALACQAAFEIHAGVKRGACGIGHRARSGQAGISRLQARAVLDGFIHQRAQLRVMELVDPVHRRPLAVLGRQRLRGGQRGRVGFAQRAVRIAEGRTAGQRLRPARSAPAGRRDASGNARPARAEGEG